MALVYRHFPLPQHLGAKPAAYAAEAAGQQGQFWEMADLIFDNQSDWAGRRNVAEIFTGYAKDLNLDLTKFQSDVAAKAIKEAVEADKVSGNKFAVAGTPTFFLNGQKIENPKNYEEFKKIINDAITKNATSTTP